MLVIPCRGSSHRAGDCDTALLGLAGTLKAKAAATKWCTFLLSDPGNIPESNHETESSLIYRKLWKGGPKLLRNLLALADIPCLLQRLSQ